MFRNYLKTAFRSLARNKSFTIINVAGLAIGIAACLLIFLIIRFETSFDAFHHEKDNIYRIVSVTNSSDGTKYSSGVPFPVAKAMRTDFPQIKKIANILNDEGQLSIINANNQVEKKFKEETGVFFTEPEFFEIFDFKWIAGNPASLAEPNTASLTKAVAEKYFGDWKSAIGKTIKYKNKSDFKITGILENVPVNSDFPLNVVLSYRSYENAELNDWVSTFGNHYCFILLPDHIKGTQITSLLPAFTEKYKPKEYWNEQLSLQPLSEMHYDNRFGNYRVTFSKELISTLSLIAAFLLIIACINFINLATAQAVKRSREVGVRKVLGGNRRQLALQFISETAIITILAILFALVTAEIVLPSLNNFLKISVRMNLLSSWTLPSFLLIVTLLVTFLSGFYPAMLLSGFNPITALKNRTAKKTGGITLRRGLVVLQFVIAQVLITGMLVVVQQMNFFRSASLGFNKDKVLLVPVPTDSLSIIKIDALKNQLLQQAGISNVSFSTFTPADDGHWSSDFRFDKSLKNTDFNADLKWADADYFKTYDLKLVAGRFYSPSDTMKEFVVNETLLKKLGIKNPEDAIGKEINFWKGEHVGPIVGVVKDFHERSLHKPISPVVLGTWREVYEIINIKIRPQRTKETLAAVENLWNLTYPDFVYEYQFLDQKIDNFYRRTDQLSQLYKIFAGIAIFISCLGLYGLVSFMAAQRTREVGIRKVLGATSYHIIYLFSKEFTILISIAFIVAGPVSYIIMNKWLEDFAFRIYMGVGLFLTAMLGSLIIAWITVVYQAVKAALANPVESLKYE